MADYFDEYNSAVSLVVGEYQALKRLDKKHKLLRLVKGVSSDGFAETKKFAKRYKRKGSHPIIVCGNYYNDLYQVVSEKLRIVLREFRDDCKGLRGDELQGKLEELLEERGLLGMVRTHLTHNITPIAVFVGPISEQ
jgi:hypothetical protein